jgi:hypothetical protein
MLFGLPPSGENWRISCAEAAVTCRIPGNLPRNRPAHLYVVSVSGNGQEKWWRLPVNRRMKRREKWS